MFIASNSTEEVASVKITYSDGRPTEYPKYVYTQGDKIWERKERYDQSQTYDNTNIATEFV